MKSVTIGDAILETKPPFTVEFEDYGVRVYIDKESSVVELDVGERVGYIRSPATIDDLNQAINSPDEFREIAEESEDVRIISVLNEEA